MALSVLILTVTAGLLLWFSLRSRYGLPLFLMTAGMAMASVAVVFQSYNTSMYSPPGDFPLRSVDLALYRFIGGWRQPLARVQGMRVAGCMLFFTGVLLMLFLILRNLKQSRRLRLWTVLLIAGAVWFSAAYLTMYLPGSAYRIYLTYHALNAGAKVGYRLWIERVDAAMRWLSLIYILLPVLVLSFAYWKRLTTYFADTYFLLTGILLLYDSVFYAVFFLPPFVQSADAVFRSGFWYFSGIIRVPTRYMLIFPGFSLLMLVFLLAGSRRIFSGELVLLSRKRAMKNSIEELNRNLLDVFHSEKNLMFSIMILAGQAREAYGTPEGLTKLERLSDVAKTRMDMITASLNRIRELHLHMEPTDIRGLLDLALRDAALPSDIQCEKRYCDFPVRCLVDEYHTRSALKNLFDNAAEALQLSQSEDKRLTVHVDASRARARISIRDNGPGIAPGEIRRVMLPFVSSKSKNTNWGIGLPYAFRVINAQMGEMRIRSCDQPGRSYTQVDILLPRERSCQK